MANNTQQEKLLAKALELIFSEKNQIRDGKTIAGFNKEEFIEHLKEFDGYMELIEELDKKDFFADPTQSAVSASIANCAWHRMKEKPAFTKAENKCIVDGLKSNYGLVSIGATIANLIADREFTLAAKKILALGVRSNIAGVIFTAGAVLTSCTKKLESQFPGKSNCY